MQIRLIKVKVLRRSLAVSVGGKVIFNAREYARDRGGPRRARRSTWYSARHGGGWIKFHLL